MLGVHTSLKPADRRQPHVIRVLQQVWILFAEYPPRGGRMMCCIIIGTDRSDSLPNCGPGKPAGVTPTMVKT